jgi:hypothetical protein
MYELHMPLVLLAQRRLTASPAEAERDFRRGVLNLKLSLETLKLEPEGCFERRIHDEAKDTVAPLEDFVRKLFPQRSNKS